MAKANDIVITPSYVAVLTKEQDGNTVYVIREATEKKGIEQMLLEKVSDPTKVTFVYDEAGPKEAHTPLYDLVMKAVGTAEELTPVKPDVSAHFELDETVAQKHRTTYMRHIPFEFTIGEKSFICETDMARDGGLAPSSTFFVLDNDDQKFLFWTRKTVDSPEIAEYIMREYLNRETNPDLSTTQPDKETSAQGKSGTEKDLTVADAGATLVEDRVIPVKKKPKKPRMAKWSYQSHIKIEDETKKEYGILRLEQEDGSLKSYGVPYDGEVTFIDLSKAKEKSLTVFDYGTSKPIWLEVNKEIESEGVKHIYKTLDMGEYEIVNTHKQLFRFSGTLVKGIYQLTANSVKYIGEEVTE